MTNAETARLIDPLFHGLSPDDEPLLVKLAARHSVLRRIAVPLLVLLPESATARRHRARAEGLLAWDGARLRWARHVDTDDDFLTDDLQGDADTIRQTVLSRVDPARWSVAFNATPATLATGIASEDEALHTALAAASCNHRHRAWATALLGNRYGVHTNGLLALATPAARIAAYRWVFDRPSPLRLRYLFGSPSPWSSELLGVFLAGYQPGVCEAGGHDLAVYAARSIPIDRLEDVLAHTSGVDPVRGRGATVFRDALAARRALARLLPDEPATLHP